MDVDGNVDGVGGMGMGLGSGEAGPMFVWA